MESPLGDPREISLNPPASEAANALNPNVVFPSQALRNLSSLFLNLESFASQGSAPQFDAQSIGPAVAGEKTKPGQAGLVRSTQRANATSEPQSNATGANTGLYGDQSGFAMPSGYERNTFGMPLSQMELNTSTVGEIPSRVRSDGNSPSQPGNMTASIKSTSKGGIGGWVSMLNRISGDSMSEVEAQNYRLYAMPQSGASNKVNKTSTPFSYRLSSLPTTTSLGNKADANAPSYGANPQETENLRKAQDLQKEKKAEVDPKKDPKDATKKEDEKAKQLAAGAGAAQKLSQSIDRLQKKEPPYEQGDYEQAAEILKELSHGFPSELMANGSFKVDPQLAKVLPKLNEIYEFDQRRFSREDHNQERSHQYRDGLAKAQSLILTQGGRNHYRKSRDLKGSHTS